MTIENCSVTASAYMRQLGSMILADNWLWLVLPVALCGVLAVWIDVRFVIVALMVLFVVVMPMLLTWLYIYYGFSPEARWSIMEKTVTVDENGLVLDFADERMKKHVIRRDDVRDIIVKDDAVLLMLTGGRRYTCLMLPASVIDPDVAQLLWQLAAQAH
jgi:hypothetical protein